MYTYEDVEKLIPETFNRYAVSYNEKGLPFSIETLTHTLVDCVDKDSRPCVFCGNVSRKIISYVYSPLLRLVVIYTKDWPNFCNVRCLRNYIVENQMELLLTLTA